MEAHNEEGAVPVPEEEPVPSLLAHEDPQEDPVDETAGSALSIMDQVREQREELKEEEHHLDLDIPGYNGLLVARYIPVRFQVIEKLAKAAQKDRSGVSKNVLASTDTLIEACQEIFLRVDGELQPIPTGSGVPVTFEKRLAEALGFEATTAREVVAGVFANEFGVIDHNVRYSKWLRDVTKEVDDDFLGE